MFVRDAESIHQAMKARGEDTIKLNEELKSAASAVRLARKKLEAFPFSSFGSWLWHQVRSI